MLRKKSPPLRPAPASHDVDTVTSFSNAAGTQLWLVATNSKGRSAAGPVQNRTAV